MTGRLNSSPVLRLSEPPLLAHWGVLSGAPRYRPFSLGLYPGLSACGRLLLQMLANAGARCRPFTPPPPSKSAESSNFQHPRLKSGSSRHLSLAYSRGFKLRADPHKRHPIGLEHRILTSKPESRKHRRVRRRRDNAPGCAEMSGVWTTAGVSNSRLQKVIVVL